MNTYRLRYIAGPQESLRASREHQIQAESFDDALATCSAWPVHYDTKGQCAWAWHPGTSLYDVEAWEAVLVAPQRS
jgi:hypothetical protein